MKKPKYEFRRLHDEKAKFHILELPFALSTKYGISVQQVQRWQLDHLTKHTYDPCAFHAETKRTLQDWLKLFEPTGSWTTALPFTN